MPTTAKTILLTGATDGIGLETARLLHAGGHRVLLHGRSATKLARVQESLAAGRDRPEGFLADLSDLAQVDEMARQVAAAHPRLDVLINNAGVYKTPQPRTATGLDLRFVVNTLAPVRLTRRLLPLLAPDGRVVNLSSAAQAPVDIAALEGRSPIDDYEAYAQSKLALTMWTTALATELSPGPRVVVAVNPGSLLDTRMVREGFGQTRGSARVGADILVQAALSPAFAEASGRYFDNDSGRFAPPHPAARQPGHAHRVVEAIEALALAGGAA